MSAKNIEHDEMGVIPVCDVNWVLKRFFNFWAISEICPNRGGNAKIGCMMCFPVNLYTENT